MSGALACSLMLSPIALLAMGQSPGLPAWPQTDVWEEVRIDSAFRSEGVAVADVNRDGLLDVLAGEVWYAAPGFARRELAPPGNYPVTGYSDCFVAGACDVDGDGWTDFLSVGFPGGEGRWFRNPQNAAGHWTKHVIAPSVCNESPAFVDLNGDGKLDLLMGIESDRRVYWLEAGASPTLPWIRHAISAPGQPGFQQFSHGLGLGDIDGDGRADVLTTNAWYALAIHSLEMSRSRQLCCRLRNAHLRRRQR
jgi:hypothetical protein